MSHETDKIAEEALEKIEGRPVTGEEFWNIHEPVVDDPRYLRGYIAGQRDFHERSVKLLLGAISEKSAPSLEP